MKTNILAIVFPLAVGIAVAQTRADLAVGMAAPDFSLPYATKDSISRSPLTLSELVGKSTVILAFYPADWSTGCTKEVCTLRDNFSSLQDLNAEVLGISGDYVWSHYEWVKITISRSSSSAIMPTPSQKHATASTKGYSTTSALFL